jgi:hypothetical protein
MGALNHIIPPATLRPYLIDAVKRGMEKELQQPDGPELERTQSGGSDECVLVGTDAS